MSEQQQSGLVPPVYPTIPQVPPPQTVTGLLSEDGQPSIFDLQLAGQPPNEDFWKSREELITSFLYAQSQTQTETLLTLDVLGGTNAINNFNYKGRVNPPTETTPYATYVPTCQLAYPRYLLSSSFEYFEGPIKFKFWAVKPVGPKGKIRIMYLPHVEVQVNPITNTNTPVILAQSDQSSLRNNMWEWDLEKQDSIEIEIFGNNPIGKIYNSRNNTVFPTTLNNEELDNNPEEFIRSNAGFPFFARTYGTLLVQVQNRYIPGSIFSDECEIFVFKSMPQAQFSLLRGPRVTFYNRVT